MRHKKSERFLFQLIYHTCTCVCFSNWSKNNLKAYFTSEKPINIKTPKERRTKQKGTQMKKPEKMEKMHTAEKKIYIHSSNSSNRTHAQERQEELEFWIRHQPKRDKHREKSRW